MKHDCYKIISGSGSIFDGTFLWILGIYTDSLLKINWNNKCIVGFFPIPEKKYVEYGHCQMVKADNQICILPHCARNLYIFDIAKECFEEIDIPMREQEYDLRGKFNIVGIKNKYVTFFGHAVQGIFTLDLETKKICVDYDYLETLYRLGMNIANPIFNHSYGITSRAIYAPVYNTSYVVKYTFDDRGVSLINLMFEDETRIVYLSEYDDNLLVLLENGVQIIWSEEKGIISFRKIKEKDWVKEGCHKIYHIDGKDYYIPIFRKEIYLYNRFDEVILNYLYPMGDIKLFEGANTFYNAIFTIENNIYFQTRSTGEIFEIDTQKDAISKIEISFDNENINNYVVSSIRHKELPVGHPIKESFPTNLLFLLSGLSEEEGN